ncbi:MAG: hypothetical protein IPH35_07845 [Rhodoferax sp.]|nr:hypothetical protein [Rhodoferax sp.]
MSEKSKLHKSREVWKKKAIDRATKVRAIRKEIRRLKKNEINLKGGQGSQS